MPRFRSKPTEIEAWRYDGSPLIKGVCRCPASDAHHLHTMHGNQVVALEVGDWIVPEPVEDRYYPIKPDVFDKKYMPCDPVAGGARYA